MGMDWICPACDSKILSGSAHTNIDCLTVVRSQRDNACALNEQYLGQIREQAKTIEAADLHGWKLHAEVRTLNLQNHKLHEKVMALQELNEFRQHKIDSMAIQLSEYRAIFGRIVEIIDQEDSEGDALLKVKAALTLKPKCEPARDWKCAKCGKVSQFKDGLCWDCFGGDPGQ